MVIPKVPNILTVYRNNSRSCFPKKSNCFRKSKKSNTLNFSLFYLVNGLTNAKLSSNKNAQFIRKNAPAIATMKFVEAIFIKHFNIHTALSGEVSLNVAVRRNSFKSKFVFTLVIWKIRFPGTFGSVGVPQFCFSSKTRSLKDFNKFT